MFEQLAHDILNVITAPIEDQRLKISLIHGMVDTTIKRKTMSEHQNKED